MPAKYFLASIVESSKDSIITIDFNGIITSWNASAEQLYGYKAAEAIGKPLTMLTLPEDLKEVLSNIDRIKHSKTVAIFDTVRVHKDGQFLELEIVLSPVKDEEGDVVGVSTIARDYTERRKTEEALHRSEEHLRITMESIKDYAILTMDLDRKVTSWNTGAEAIFGFTEAEMIGRPADIIFTPEDIAAGAPEQESQTALAKGSAADERWHIRKDRSRFYASGVMTQLRDGELRGFVKVARDLTERKQAEQLKEVFIGVASHELRTPVTSIKAYVELLHDTLAESGNTGTGESIALIEKLNGQVDRLAALVKDLLDVTRISEGKIQLDRERFSITDLIAETAEELQRTTKHVLETDLQPIPEIQADRERIRQVLVNLISNAIKYSPDADKVRITAVRDDLNIIVCIHDYGIGMTAATAAQVFERFYRAVHEHERVNTYPGLGLGLYIASEIVKRHGGRIWVQSEPGGGAAFYFSLQLTNSDEADRD